MTLTARQIQYMVEERTADLIRMTMDNEGLSMLEAFDKVYNSKTYQNLLNPQSQLYYQSSGYVYDLLTREVKN
ncbi:MAG: hypothetical protein U0L77_00335 [Prevotellamassilia sp.]|nr:hypothetical protein [Prevotellamassilia sp.]